MHEEDGHLGAIEARLLEHVLAHLVVGVDAVGALGRLGVVERVERGLVLIIELALVRQEHAQEARVQPRQRRAAVDDALGQAPEQARYPVAYRPGAREQGGLRLRSREGKVAGAQ